MIEGLSRNHRLLIFLFFMQISLARFWRFHCAFVCEPRRARGRIELTTTMFSGENGIVGDRKLVL